MTEREADVLTTRLGRIWGFDVYGKREFYRPRFWLEVELNEGVRLTYSWHYIAGHSRVTLIQTPEGKEAGHLYWGSSDPGIMGIGLIYSDREKECFQPFAREWMGFFRRGCWLSGCDIEATAHEKVAWTQGFSREEIEAWDLKF